VYPFIGYDGNYYLCSSDWRKEVDLGSVFERRLVDLLEDKAEQVCGASPICRDCTHEPTNAMAHALARAAEARPEDVHRDLAASVEVLVDGLDHFDGCLTAMRTHVPPAHTPPAALTWPPTGGPITVDPRTGVLTAPVETGPDTKVTATAAGLQADGTAVCAPSWSTPGTRPGAKRALRSLQRLPATSPT
jgi:hypothetical protein